MGKISGFVTRPTEWGKWGREGETCLGSHMS